MQMAPKTDHPATSVSKEADFSINAILTAADETAYYWDLASDRIVWAPNAPTILNIKDISLLRTGYGFETLISQGLSNSRRDTLLASNRKVDQQDAMFSIQYALGKDAHGDPLWLEDHGRWTTDDAGTPNIVKGVVRLINERHEKEQKLDFLSRHDQLTGQINRGELWEAISDAFLISAESENSYALLVVGINNLLMINDAFGFDTGDEVIAAIARRLRSQLRDTDIIGRFSSNKFGLLLVRHQSHQRWLAPLNAYCARSVMKSSRPVLAPLR